ncbi:MAG: ribonuclease G [Gammaproteobacteria bacterium]|nr:ribonuclease G [Gammaproteobacteria bacterium]
MSEEILINVTPREVRAALLENGVVQELLVERATRRGLISNIYKGRVRRVLPGMQAAFIDIGLERTAFLHESDISRGPDTEQGPAPAPTAGIRDLLTEGGDILVQVLKDPLGSKGARLTTYITLPSRYLVLLPRGQGVGVSARIEDEDEKRRLREIMEEIVGPDATAGFIVRTAAEGASREALRADMMFLEKLWESIQQRAQRTAAGSLVHEDLPLWLRVLRDLLSAEMERVLIDSEQAFSRMQEFAAMFIPQMLPMIEHYKGKRPIFDLHNIEDEIQRALDRKVPLKSGGYLMIDQTEAMTTVDVNTGAYVGHRNLEETIFRTNLEASVAIARQLRLRNLGGIIIIDFIDMLEADHRQQVMQELERALQRDPARSQIMEVSSLGLVEMTRKRTRESLERMLCEPCPICEGRGFIKTAETVCYEIFREIVRQHRQFEFQELMVMAHQDVVERLLDEESASLAELEEFTGKPIRLQTDAMYSQEQFDVVLM